MVVYFKCIRSEHHVCRDHDTGPFRWTISALTNAQAARTRRERCGQWPTDEQVEPGQSELKGTTYGTSCIAGCGALNLRPLVAGIETGCASG